MGRDRWRKGQKRLLCLFDFAEKVEVECGLALVESRAKKTTTAITKLRKG